MPIKSNSEFPLPLGEVINDILNCKEFHHSTLKKQNEAYKAVIDQIKVSLKTPLENKFTPTPNLISVMMGFLSSPPYMKRR